MEWAPDDPLNPALFPPPKDKAQQQRRFERSKAEFAKIELSSIIDNDSLDEILPARARLFVYLVWATNAGGGSTTVSNTVARRLRISRQLKGKCLALFEELGLFRVEQRPGRSPVVHRVGAPRS